MGYKGVKDVIDSFGKEQNVKEVIIYRARRTTGANPGKITAPLKLKSRSNDKSNI